MRHIQANEYINAKEHIHLTKFVAKKEHNEATHTHNFLEIEYIWLGHGLQTVNDQTYVVKRGDLIFIDINNQHAYSTDTEMGIINCLLTPEFFKHDMPALDTLSLSCFHNYYNFVASTQPKVSFRGKEMLDIEVIIDCMLAEYNTKFEGYLLLLQNYVNIFLSNIFRAMNRYQQETLPQPRNKHVAPILQYIEDHYTEKISLQALAHNHAYTPNYFSKIFKMYVGKTFSTYLNEVRLNKAMQLIQETDLTIEDICHHIGYNDKKQFYKLFKAHTGQTPKHYRDTS